MMRRRYEGTTLGKQELHAEILDKNPNALFSYDNFKLNEISKSDLELLDETGRKLIHNITQIKIGIDPAGSHKLNSDYTAITVGGCDERPDGAHGYIFESHRMRCKPDEWAKFAVKLYEKYKANAIVIEKNYGGDMCKSVLLNVNKNLNVEEVSAIFEAIRRYVFQRAVLGTHGHHLLIQ